MVKQHKPDVIFVLSVDTEEEWDWSDEFPQKDFSVSNVKQIPKLQAFCEELGIRPTYFTDYAVVENPDAAEEFGIFALPTVMIGGVSVTGIPEPEMLMKMVLGAKVMTKKKDGSK